MSRRPQGSVPCHPIECCYGGEEFASLLEDKPIWPAQSAESVEQAAMTRLCAQQFNYNWCSIMQSYWSLLLPAVVLIRSGSEARLRLVVKSSQHGILSGEPSLHKVGSMYTLQWLAVSASFISFDAVLDPRHYKVVRVEATSPSIPVHDADHSLKRHRIVCAWRHISFNFFGVGAKGWLERLHSPFPDFFFAEPKVPYTPPRPQTERTLVGELTKFVLQEGGTDEMVDQAMQRRMAEECDYEADPPSELVLPDELKLVSNIVQDEGCWMELLVQEQQFQRTAANLDKHITSTQREASSGAAAESGGAEPLPVKANLESLHRFATEASQDRLLSACEDHDGHTRHHRWQLTADYIQPAGTISKTDGKHGDKQRGVQALLHCLSVARDAALLHDTGLKCPWYLSDASLF